MLKPGLGYGRRCQHAILTNGNGPLERYLIELTGQVLGSEGRAGGAGDRFGPGPRGAKGHRQMDGERGARRRRTFDVDQRGCLCPLPVCAQGRGRGTGGAAICRASSLASVAIAVHSWNDLRQALYASKLISYTQGFQMLSAAAASYRWMLDYGRIAEVWRGGCIIRSVFLDRISQAYERKIRSRESAARSVLCRHDAGPAARVATRRWHRGATGHPDPRLSAALAYFDGYRSARLPAESAAGAARRFRCPHLRAYRSPPW